MLVSDYDGTFYVSDEDIKNNIRMVKLFQKSGGIFIINTGRGFPTFKEEQEKYHFPYDYVILNHGATILTRDDEILSDISIDRSIISSLQKDLNLKECVNYFCCSGIESRKDFSFSLLSKIHVQYATLEEAKKKNEQIQKKYSCFVRSYLTGHNSIEVVSSKVDKGLSVSFLAERLTILVSSIYTIGDSYSDISMISKFHGYCVSHAIDEVKEVSKGVYPSVASLTEDILSNRI